MSQPPVKRLKQETLPNIFAKQRKTSEVQRNSLVKAAVTETDVIDLTDDLTDSTATYTLYSRNSSGIAKLDNKSSYTAVDRVVSGAELDSKETFSTAESTSKNQKLLPEANAEDCSRQLPTHDSCSSDVFQIEDPDGMDDHNCSPSQNIQNESGDLFDSSLSDSELLELAPGLQKNADEGMSDTVVYSNSDELDDCLMSQSQRIELSDLITFPKEDAVRQIYSDTTNHTIYVKTPVTFDKVPKPDPDVSSSIWDEFHVRMPHSSQNIYPAGTTSAGKPDLKPRWAMIEEVLMQPMRSSYDIKKAILAYNSRYKDKWDFTNLHRFFTDMLDEQETRTFFHFTLPGMVQLALTLPSLIKKGIPLLKQNIPHKLTFSQHQVASLLANAFFCTYPRRNASHRTSEFANYPTINMNGLFATSARGNSSKNRDGAILNKLKCLITYFTSVCSNVPKGCVTYERASVDVLTSEQVSQSDRLFTDTYFTSQKLIEDAEGLLQADFANKRLGGGVLQTGCVQEEIQFVLHPELIASRLFTESLADHEVMIIKGVQRFSAYTGYSDNFKFSGEFFDNTASDAHGRLYRHIVAMDATHYNNYLEQFAESKMLRELNKARCAFNGLECPAVAVATGNWGCGAFRGEHKLKAIIQLMAAAECGRQVYYSVFGDAKLKFDLYDFYVYLRKKRVTVGNLWNLLLRYEQEVISEVKKDRSNLSPDIIRFIKLNAL